MKKTMKFLSIVALALVGAVMTSCSSEDNAVEQAPQQPTSKDNIVTLTTTVSLGGDEAGARSTTRAVDAEGHKTFSVGDQIDVVYVNTSGNSVKATSVALTSSDIKNSGKSADFTVTLTNPQTGIATSIRYFYPAGKVDAEGSLDFSWLDEQNGTIEGLSSNEDICYSTDSWYGEKLPSLDLTNYLTIGKFTIKNSGGTDITSTITGMTVSDGTDTYNITRSAAAGPIWVAMRPISAGSTVTVTATDGTNNYSKTITIASGKDLLAGNIYPINVTMQLKTITWSATKIDSEKLAMNLIDEGYNSDEKSSDGITVTVCTGEFGDQVQFTTYLYIGDGWGSINFSSSVGRISKIEMNHTGNGQWNDEAGSGWPAGYNQASGGTYTWSGSPSTSVTLEGEGHLNEITSIVFTFE